MLRSSRFAIALAVVFASGFADLAAAQITPNQPSSPSSNTQRTVGRKGARQSSLFGTLTVNEETTREPVFNSRGQVVGENVTTEWNTNITTFLEQAWLVSDHFALKFGTLFSGGTGSSTTGVTGGLRFYLTPGGGSSLYLAGNGGLLASKFGDQTTSAGLAEGGLGFESVAGQNASFFTEGLAQTIFASGSRQTQFLLVFGLRIVY